MQIYQDTILQLVVRQGSNSDRILTTFKAGEPLFTTDTKRFYVGNGLPGGTVSGNIFQGSSSDITTFNTSVVGDMAYDVDKRQLYTLDTQNPTSLSAWRCVAGESHQMFAKYDGASNTMLFSRGINTTVVKLSAGHYKFSYPSTGTSNMIAHSQVYGLSAAGYDARTIAISNSACEIKVLNSLSASMDAVLTIQIIY